MIQGGALFLIDKTPGPTSFDVVRQVKNLIGDSKVGHTGSLDPFASGLLILLSGKATRLSDVLLTSDKSYFATVKLGERTDTLDRTGTIDATAEIPELTEEKIKEVLQGFEGEWLQTPPAFSAKKVHGVRLYELARQNIKVRRPKIPVQLHQLEFISYKKPFLEFTVTCSKGTYVRALASELGERLGTVAHLAELRRLSCGSFDIKRSVTVEELQENWESHYSLARQNLQVFLSGLRQPLGGQREESYHQEM
jgi:tRNA pseudouridine55 synthase